MTGERPTITILMADDDEEDREFARDALESARVVNDFRWVQDGEELLRYLRREGEYGAPGAAPRPGLILLDLKMPRMGGLEALEVIRETPALSDIPVVVLTTSSADEDITRSYDLGANSYIRKPVTFQGLVDAMETLGKYWLEIVELPRARAGS